MNIKILHDKKKTNMEILISVWKCIENINLKFLTKNKMGGKEMKNSILNESLFLYKNVKIPLRGKWLWYCIL